MTRPPSKPRVSRSGPSGGNLGIPIMLRAKSQEQKARWQAAAQRARRNLSDWMRVTLDDEASK